MSRIVQRVTRAKANPVSSFTPAQTALMEKHQSFGTIQHMDGDNRKPLVLQPPLIQPKLAIGQPNDKYEQEAGRIADKVIAMPDPKLQRQPGNEEEE